MLNAKGRRCDVCARSPLLFFIFILSDVLARFKVIVMNYFGYQVELYKHIRKKQIFLIKIMFLHSKIALQNVLWTSGFFSSLFQMSARHPATVVLCFPLLPQLPVQCGHGRFPAYNTNRSLQCRLPETPTLPPQGW